MKQLSLYKNAALFIFLLESTSFFAQNDVIQDNTLWVWSNQYASTFTANRFIHAQVFWLQFRQKFNLVSTRVK